MLTPEEIASKDFLVSLRGYDRDEVQRFLSQVAEEVAGLQRRNRELEASLNDARSQVPAPQPDTAPAVREPTDTREAFRALGDETTRILVAAEDSARSIRQKAEERAQQEVEQARREAREEVESARRTASKVVSDAERRRNQIAEDLRGLESVRDTLAERLREAVRATESTMRGLAPASTDDAGGDRGLPAPPPSPAASPGSLRDVPDLTSVSTATSIEGDDELAEVSTEQAAAEATEETDEDEDEPEPEPELADEERHDTLEIPRVSVDAAQAPSGPEAPAVEEPAAGEPEEPDGGGSAAGEAEAEAWTAGVPAAGVPAAGEPEEPGEPAASPGPRQLREQTLATIRPGMLRRLKRALQDVQNGVLDALRQHGGEGDLDAYLPGQDDLAPLASLGEEFLAEAYQAGLADGASLADQPLPDGAADPSRVPARSATFGAVMSHEVSAAVKATLGAGIGAGEPPASLSERVGEVFRDLKGPVVEVTVDEHLSRTYGYGTVDAWRALGVEAKEWVPGIAPRCPEEMRAQNAEQGAVALDAEFPTGQVVPPAHDGCDCTLRPR